MNKIFVIRLHDLELTFTGEAVFMEPEAFVAFTDVSTRMQSGTFVVTRA